MSLLDVLRPADTSGWDRLDEKGQLLLLQRARVSGHLPTLRMLAGLRSLSGEARRAILAEREPSVRKKVLVRSDLSKQESAALFASETRASVLASAAGSFPAERLDEVIAVATSSRGTSLSEALLVRSRLSEAQADRLMRDLAARRPFSKLAARTADAVMKRVPPDPELLLWVLADSGVSRYNLWHARSMMNRISGLLGGAEDAVKILDAMAEAGHGPVVQNLADRLLSGEKAVSGSSALPIDQTALLADMVERRLRKGEGGWAAFRTTIGPLLAQLAPLLPDAGGPGLSKDAGLDKEEAPEKVDLAALDVRDLAALLSRGERLDAVKVSLLACNPNHTDETARKVAAMVSNTPGASLELMDRFSSLSRLVWAQVVSTGGYGSATVSVEKALERLGEQRLGDLLVDPEFWSATSSRHWWGRRWPLLNGSPLEWLLEDEGMSDPVRVRVALRLPVSETLRGQEALVFTLLASKAGDRPEVWDVVDGLAADWEGSFAGLLEVAEQVAR